MKIPLILGPTCSWKSAVAARLANRAGGEVVSLDSMQIYKGLPIGTAQPGEEELALARHHLVACLELDEVWNVSRFIEVVKPLPSPRRVFITPCTLIAMPAIMLSTMPSSILISSDFSFVHY